jgi:hypothetical protein
LHHFTRTAIKSTVMITEAYDYDQLNKKMYNTVYPLSYVDEIIGDHQCGCRQLLHSSEAEEKMGIQ